MMVLQCFLLSVFLLVFTEYRNNFNKQSLWNTTYNFEYDYDSIMHYGQYFFRSVLLSLRTRQVKNVHSTLCAETVRTACACRKM